MSGIRAHMERLGLASYANVFEQHGFDTWDDVLEITENDLIDLHVKLGHRRRLQREIANWKGVPVEQVRASTERASSIDAATHTADEEGVVHASDVGRAASKSVTGKRRYRRHPKPDKNAPDRPPSAYVLFSNKIREELKPKNLSFTEIAKIVGERWQRLGSNNKEPFERQAGSLKEDYNSKFSEYRKTDLYKEYMDYLTKFKADQAAAGGLSGGDGKRLKLETTDNSPHGSSRGSAGTPTASVHDSPMSASTSLSYPPLSEVASSTMSSPTGSTGISMYSQLPSIASEQATLPARYLGHGQPGPGPDHTSSSAFSTSLQRQPASRRSQNRPAPYLRKPDPNHTSTSASSQSYHSSSSLGQDSSAPRTSSIDMNSGIPRLPPLDRSTPPPFGSQGMQRLHIGGQAPQMNAPFSLANHTATSGPLPSFARPESVSRTLPLPTPTMTSSQQKQLPNRFDGMSILALAGRMIDEDQNRLSSSQGQPPEPPRQS